MANLQEPLGFRCYPFLSYLSLPMLRFLTMFISSEHKYSFNRLTDKAAFPLTSLSVIFKILSFLSVKFFLIYYFIKILSKTILKDSFTQLLVPTCESIVLEGLFSVVVWTNHTCPRLMILEKISPWHSACLIIAFRQFPRS